MQTQTETQPPKLVQLRLKPELHQWVHQEAKAQDRSANWIINKLLETAKSGSVAQ